MFGHEKGENGKSWTRIGELIFRGWPPGGGAFSQDLGFEFTSYLTNSD